MAETRPTDEFEDLSPEAWRLLEGRVAAFEAAWLGGGRPEIADHLLDPDPTDGQLLLELVHVDAEFRRGRGESVRTEEYLAAFPSLRSRSERLSGLGDAGPAAAAEGVSSAGTRPEDDPAAAGPPTLIGEAASDGFELVGLPSGGPPSDGPDAAAAAFERAWASGRRPAIEDYLGGTPEPDRTALFERLLRLDIRHRRGRGETPRPEDYSTRFPEYTERLSGTDWKGLAANTVVYAPGAAPADKIGRFELLERLGTGGFGTVWKARDAALDRVVAVKLPHPHRIASGDPSFVLREARAAARLRHPSVVRIHEAAVEGGRPYIVYDYVEGVSLQEWLTAKRPTPREAAELCATLADALGHAHSMGVVHRDVKPANVLLDRQGRPHVTDFGMAKRTAATDGDAAGDDAPTRDGAVIGSLPYMSPEQASGRSNEADARTDVYGLGVILYELLTGRRPFVGADAAVLHLLLTEDPPAPRSLRKEIPRDLETVCHKAMAKDPRRRYASAGELAADLRRFLAGEPIRARRVRGWERVWKAVRRRPAAATAPAAIAICALAFATADFRRQAPPPGTEFVSIDTDPPGAEMRFVPLDPVTGEPRPEKMIDPGRSPVAACPLAPGDYLVVAALDPEPDGRRRFHEVYRHVPPVSETTPEARPHRMWFRGEDGGIRLPAITIPPPSVTDGMARAGGADRFRVRPEGLGLTAPHVRRIPAFLIDTHEFTFADYVRVTPGTKGKPADARVVARPADWAVTSDHDGAMYRAERAGKRLPTEAEYEFAATAGGNRRYPWGDGPAPFGPAMDKDGFGPVGTPASDRVDFDRPVFGLGSNVAEWTGTRYAFDPTVPGPARTVAQMPPEQYRIVRGGDLRTLVAEERSVEESRDPRRRTPVYRSRIEPGLGFRCVRSAEPRLRPEDFEVVLPDAGS